MTDEEGLDFSFLRALHKQKGRYVVFPSGYVIDRSLFRWYILIMGACVAILITPAVLSGHYYDAYVSCPEDAIGGSCLNPLYGECDLPACQAETLRAGESIGEPPKPLSGPIFAMVAPLIILFLFNHFSQQGTRYKNVRDTHNKQDRERRRSDKKTHKR